MTQPSHGTRGRAVPTRLNHAKIPGRRAGRLRTLGAATSILLLLGIGGCGSGTVSDPGGEQPGTGGKLSIQTATGKVQLPGPAKKVVSLDWAYTENLRALGVTPVGHAEIADYRTWVTAEGAELPRTGVTELGTRTEPSMEQIRALQPDVIITENFRAEGAMRELRNIAPVLAFDFTTKPQLATMRKNFRELAKAVGKQDAADRILGQMDNKLADVAERIKKAGKANTRYAIAQGFTDSGAPTIRLFTDRALVGQLMGKLGLRNGWTGEPDAWGMTTVGIESLTRIPSDATFLHVSQNNDNVFAGQLAENPVWQNLPFVKRDRVRGLDAGTWLFGGPLSAMQLADETAKALRVR